MLLTITKGGVMKSLFGEALPVIERSLDLRAFRHHLISANVANADTPGYKAFDVALEAALETVAQPETPTRLETTAPDHVTLVSSPQTPFPVVQVPSSPLDAKGDGNTVDLDREMSVMAANGLVYTVLAQAATKEYQLMAAAIGEK